MTYVDLNPMRAKIAKGTGLASGDSARPQVDEILERIHCALGERRRQALGQVLGRVRWFVKNKSSLRLQRIRYLAN
jgi:hypothetical protein